MTRYQHMRRLALWRGSLSMLTACTVLMLFGALADLLTQ